MRFRGWMQGMLLALSLVVVAVAMAVPAPQAMAVPAPQAAADTSVPSTSVPSAVSMAEEEFIRELGGATEQGGPMFIRVPPCGPLPDEDCTVVCGSPFGYFVCLCEGYVCHWECSCP